MQFSCVLMLLSTYFWTVKFKNLSSKLVQMIAKMAQKWIIYSKFSGGFAPWAPTRGTAPGPRWGAAPPKPPAVGVLELARRRYAAPRSHCTSSATVRSLTGPHAFGALRRTRAPPKNLTLDPCLYNLILCFEIVLWFCQ